MSFKYDDLQDLIQNQRALAELTGKIKENYDRLQTDIDFVKEVNDQIGALNESMTTTLESFDLKIAESSERMENALEEVTTTARELKESTQQWLDALQIDADNNPTNLQKLVNDIVYLTDFVLNGKKLPDGTYSGGLEDIRERLATLEAKTPGIVITEEDVPTADRVEGVLYGRITDEVTDIESGQTIKISPYLQGVVVD